MDTSKLKKLPNGEGGFGECYIVDQNTLYKKFYKLSSGKYPFEADRFNDFVGIKNKNFVFPNEIETNGEYTIGYTMDYIHAKDLKVLNYNYSISDFIMALDDLKESLYELAYLGIVIADVNDKNILFDDQFHIIDTDLYIMDNERHYDMGHNEDYLVNYLNYLFVYADRTLIIKDLLDSNEDLNLSNRIVERDYTISALKDFLIELREIATRLFGKEVENFSEIYDGLERTR